MFTMTSHVEECRFIVEQGEKSFDDSTKTNQSINQCEFIWLLIYNDVTGMVINNLYIHTYPLRSSGKICLCTALSVAL